MDKRIPGNPNVIRKIYQMPWQTFITRLKTKQKTLSNLKDSDNSSKKLLAQHRGLYDLEWFAKRFFPSYCDAAFSQMHEKLFEYYPNQERAKKVVIAAPRGHAKTTIMLTIQALHAICYGYEPFIVIVAQCKKEAESRVKQILYELRHNEAIIETFGHLAPALGKGGNTNFTTTNNVMVKAVSRGQSIRGLNHRGNRPSMIILDDVETLEGVQNPEQREKTQEWFDKDVMSVGQIDGSSNFIVIGTCLHQESLISTLLTKSDWKRERYQAVLTWSTNKSGWSKWKSIFTDLRRSNPKEDAHQYYLDHQDRLLQGTSVLWEEVEPYEKLMIELVSIGKKAFYSEKQNIPFDPSEQLFNMPKAKRFTYDIVTGDIQWKGSEHSINRDDLHTVIAFHDPAAGEDTGDYAAIVVVGKDADNYYYVLDASVKKHKVDQQIEAAYEFHKKWGLNFLHIEGNGFQGTLLDSYNKRFEDSPSKPIIKAPNSRGNKEQRIASLQPHIENGHLLFNTSLPDEFIRQLSHFPTDTYDDGPDALHGAVNYLSNKTDLRQRRETDRTRVRPQGDPRQTHPNRTNPPRRNPYRQR